jgi:hypothetical protein
MKHINFPAAQRAFAQLVVTPSQGPDYQVADPACWAALDAGCCSCSDLHPAAQRRRQKVNR